jgi:hypothetical protein
MEAENIEIQDVYYGNNCTLYFKCVKICIEAVLATGYISRA